MSAAKYYIYRNLRTGGFSVKHHGRVVYHAVDIPISISDATFKVNEKSRQRVIKEKQKNVHAYIVCDNFEITPKQNIDKINKVLYNPYQASTFMYFGKPIMHASKIYLENGACYLMKK